MNLLNGRVAGYADAATIGVRPEHLVASRDGGTWSGTVTVAEHVGSDTFLYVSSDKLGDITVRSIGELGVKPGDRISMTPEPGRLHRFDANGLAIPAH
jgi:multiple sugar transport system ATP-binding protein